MKEMIRSNRFLFLSLLILGAAFTRLVPHYPNFTAIGAMALFGGARFERKEWAFIVTFAAMLISDAVIGFHAGMLSVYVSFGLIVGIGIMMSRQKTLSTIVLGSVMSSVLFFVLTNFHVWLAGQMYPKTFEGLIACYVAAVPFFHYNLLGDLFYAGTLFGIYELVKIKVPVLVRA